MSVFLILFVVLALVCMFSIPLLIHFTMSAEELEQSIASMKCSNCKHCACRVFPTESGTEVFYQCHDPKTDTWTDTEPNKLCERYVQKRAETDR